MSCESDEVIYGAGELSFWWKASCEPSIEGEHYDFGTFYNGSTVVTNIAGKTDWQQVTIKASGTGKHDG